jgi:hypothetical protein
MYAIIDVYDDKLQVRGFGSCESAVYPLDHTTTTTNIAVTKEEETYTELPEKAAVTSR